MPGPLRAGELGVIPGAIDRQSDRFDSDDIAHQAVGDKAGEPLVARHAENEVSSHRRAGEAVGGRHDDVAAFGGIECPEYRKIVGRAAMAGHGDADQGQQTWRRQA